MDLTPNEVDKLLQAETTDADWNQLTREVKAKEAQESLLKVVTAVEDLLADIEARGLYDDAEKLTKVKNNFAKIHVKLHADEKLDDGKKRHKVDLPDNTMHGVVPTPGREM